MAIAPGSKVLNAYGQANTTVQEVSIDSSDFPSMRASFAYVDAGGNFIDTLKADQVKIIEGEDIRPVDSLRLDQPGVRLTLAVNVSRELGRQYAQIPLFTPVMSRLKEWAGSVPAEANLELALATNTDLSMPRNGTASEWMKALSQLEQTSLAQYDSGVTALQDAVSGLIDASGMDQRKKAILYITGIPTVVDAGAMRGIQEMAAGQDIKIFVWAVAPGEIAYGSPSLFAALQGLADATGGSLFLFTGAEGLPDINSYLNPLRYKYLAEYQSGIASSGPQVTAVMLTIDGQEIVSAPLAVYVDVAPPKPIFLAPPAEVNLNSLENNQLQLKILVEFPDGHPRELTVSRLLMDGVTVAENKSAPYNTFIMDVPADTVEGERMFAVEVEDVLRLSARSIDIPVDLVRREPGETAAQGAKQNWQIWLLAILAGAAGVALIVFFVRRALKVSTAKPAATISATTPLVTQLLGRASATEKRTTRPRPRTAEERSETMLQSPANLARLIRISNDEIWVKSADLHNTTRPYSIPAIPLGRWEVRIGTDVSRTTVRIADPSLDSVHAKILPSTGKKYTIQDMESAAGTWVNFEPVPADGIDLQDGDIVQLGAVTFRFELAKNPDQ